MTDLSTLGPVAEEIRPFWRHIERVHYTPPGLAPRRPLYIGSMTADARIGSLDGRLEEHLKNCLPPNAIKAGGAVVLAEGMGLAEGAQALRDLCMALLDVEAGPRFGEWFDVFNEAGNLCGEVERGLVPLLGTRARGAHLNGLVKGPGGMQLWVGTRSRTKRLDPGLLDHLAAGGVGAGFSPLQTMVKEAGEEAGLPPELARQVRPSAVLHYQLNRPEGLRRDEIHCYDLVLPGDFIPQPVDHEVERFELMPLSEVFDRVRDTDDFKFNVNLVLIDLFIRQGLFSAEGGEALRAALAGMAPGTETKQASGGPS
ncbi:NUDIX domain-containing protein [Formicincola oecophyllae]|uniref:NUDIX domain-containing protein n=1 Tax=Formicincola oecophyllae TaxID=2558361 RepID=A0A4Y6U9D1_9PROT|nr:NUDIX domain-containing protein [Formicincola oecophyllae]QDH12981.1 NUDIX domain-containing protein [Formicincola oecophyllae]